MLAWRIYYADGTTFDSSMGGPDDAPAWGVIVIVQPSIHGGARPLDGQRYYIYEDGRWIGASWDGILDKLAHRIKFSGFLVGRWVHDAVYLDVWKRMKSDPDFFGGAA